MATIEQLPGELNIITTQHDDLSILLDFDIVLTGYTFASEIEVSLIDSILTIANTDLSTGKITLTASRALLLTIPIGIHRWYLDWIAPGTLHRRVLSGTFTLKE